MDRFSGIIDNFMKWGETEERLKAAIIVGSQARENHPADKSSDLDIVMIVRDPGYFVTDDQWLEKIGKYHISFIEGTLGGDQERRVLFDDALDVDFVLFPEAKIGKLEESGELPDILLKGWKPLIDKTGICEKLSRLPGERSSYQMPSEEEFVNTVSDFWYHTVWTTKKLIRGELWATKSCADNYMKWKLLDLIEWYAHAYHGMDYDTWHEGRYLDEWAEEWIVQELARCYARYEKEDMKRALLATMNLFRSLAVSISDKLHYSYPQEADSYATEWVRTTLKR